MIVGRRPWMCAASRRATTPTRWRRSKSGRWWSPARRQTRCRCACSTPATIPKRSRGPSTPGPSSAWPCWCGCAVRVRAWADVHAKTQHHPARGSRRPRPTHRGTLVLVEVEHLPRQTRIPKRLWLWWRGPGTPDLAILWRAYVHRVDLEHSYRFCKQGLNGTTPRVRQPEHADRWTWVVLVAYT